MIGSRSKEALTLEIDANLLEGSLDLSLGKGLILKWLNLSNGYWMNASRLFLILGFKTQAFVNAEVLRYKLFH